MSGVTDNNERLYNGIGNVLARMHRKVSMDDQMELIRQRYPSPALFLESNRFMLDRIGISRLDAFYFTMIPSLSRYVSREGFGKKPRLNTLSRMCEYLRTLFIGIHVECFYVAMLDSRGCMIDTVLVRKGTADSAPFYLKEMLSIVVQKHAKAVVLCHNHPCGTLQPSKEDITCTLRALNAMMALNVPMLDHVIIAQDRAVSIRDTGIIPSLLWTMQAPKNKLMREWIDVDLLQE